MDNKNQSGAAVRGEAVAECREDGRCQYAIDHGAEGMGHCPEGKCCMPSSARAADALDSQPTEPAAEVRARVRDAVWEQIKGNYYCGRVWDAWQVGTMTQDDFEPSEDSDEVLDNITDAVIVALSSQPTDGGVRNG